MRRRTYFNMKICGSISTLIVLQCLVLQSVQGGGVPGLLAGLSGTYNLPQPVQQYYQNQYFSPGAGSADVFDFFRHGGRFKLPQRKISFNRQDTLGYTFGQAQNAQQSLGFVSSPGGTYQPVSPDTTVKGPINLSSVASIGSTYAPFVTQKETILPQVQPTQVPLSSVHSASSNPIVKPFSHPRFPFSSQGASLFPNSQVVQNVPASSSPGTSGSLSFSQNPNPTVSSLFNYYPQRVSSHISQNYRSNYFNFPHNSFTSQSPSFNQNPSSVQPQINIKPVSIDQYSRTQDAPVSPQFTQSRVPSPTVSPYTLQPTQASVPQYPQQNSLSVSYLTNNQQSINSLSSLTNPLLSESQPTLASNPPQYQSGSNLPVSDNRAGAVQNIVNKATVNPTPAIYQEVKELPHKSITYQLNPDSSITPLQVSKGDISSLEDPNKEIVKLVNRVAGTKLDTKNTGSSGFSNPPVFPTSAPRFPSPAPNSFQQNQFQQDPQPNQFQQGPQPNQFQQGPQPNQFQQGPQPNQFQQGPQPNQFQQNQFQQGPQPNQFQQSQFQQGPQPNQFQQNQFQQGPQPNQFQQNQFQQGPQPNQFQQNQPPPGFQPNRPFNFPPGQENFPPFGPQGPQGPQGPNGGPPPELENGFNPNHLEAFPEPPYESEFANQPPLDTRDASELAAYVRTRNLGLQGEHSLQGRKAPDSSSIRFPNDADNYRILNPSDPPTSPTLAGLTTEEVVRIANGKPVPRECAYNTITEGTLGEDCIGVKKKK